MTKECRKCGNEKHLKDYHNNKRKKDGKSDICKYCTNKAKREREANLRQTDPEWVDRHRAKCRMQYWSGGKERRKKKDAKSVSSENKRFFEKFPEKYQARNRSRTLKAKVKGNELHHWSYRFEHHKDVIELDRITHRKAHRYMIYDQEQMMYRTLEGVLLDTRESHIKYIKSLKSKD